MSSLSQFIKFAQILQLVNQAALNAAAMGLIFKGTMYAASTADLTATYNNGTGGVGATLTGSGWTIDGIAIASIPNSSLICVANQTSQFQNGIYVKTSNTVLTRSSTYDNSTPGQINTGDYVAIANGTTYGGAFLQQTTPAPVIVGTTAIVWQTFSLIGAGTGLFLQSPNTLAISNTGVTAQTINDASKTINATVNARGQLTSLVGLPILITSSQVSDFAAAASADAPVQSVNTKVGDVALKTADVPELSNLYYTSARATSDANAAIAAALATDQIQAYNANLNAIANINPTFFKGPIVLNGASAYTAGGGATFAGTSFNNLTNGATWGEYFDFSNANAKSITLDATGLPVGFNFSGGTYTATGFTFTPAGGNAIHGATSCLPFYKWVATLVLNSGNPEWFIEVGQPQLLNASGLLPASLGGTGVNNSSNTFTYGGNITFSGAFNFTATLTAATTVTFPVSGTLVTTIANNVAFTGGTINGVAIGATTPSTGNFSSVKIAQPSGFTGGSPVMESAGVQTLNATQTVLGSIFVGTSTTMTVSGIVSGATSDHSNAVGGTFTITATRTAAGNVTLVGNVITNVNSSSTATFTCGVNTISQEIKILVSGVAATTYNWTTTYTYLPVVSNV